jgi:tetratricopeptide (TPR) repeat protein
MNKGRAQVPDKLREKFPHLRPVERAPVLWTINGIGLTMYGKRDVDTETGTYVKTHCFSVLFIPVLAIGAYRVADAERGWYFLARDRLSSFAVSCNVGLVLLALLFGSIMAKQAYFNSPEYQAREKLKQAAAALRDGNARRAVGLYRQVAEGPARAEEGRQGLSASMEACLTNSDAAKVATGFRLLAGWPKHLNSPPLVPQAYQRGLQAVERFRASDPDGAVTILHEVVPLGPTNNSLRPMELELLKAAIAAKPDNTNRVSDLAVLYEEQNQLADCYALLAPYQDRLGATEGARILGQHLLQNGQYDKAYALLFPYVQERLEKLRPVERNYTNTMAKAYERGIQVLREGNAGQAFYDKYEKASKAEKGAMVADFTEKWMRDDPAVQRAMKDLQAANRIVHVTLDLGIVQLNRAQVLTEPAARKSELEAAEKTFLAIHGLAGDTDEYRMFLGQVYYWLGRAQEGQALFDKLLASHKRAYETLIEVGHTLRQVGEDTQARDLIEEAYRTAKEDQEKFQAASLRARLQKDLDDHVSWLERADTNDPNIRVELYTGRGEQALREGKREQAAAFLKQAVAGYQNLPQNSATFNNCGLTYLSLYEVTGELEDHNHGLDLMERALNLNPGNSVLLVNITHLLATRAFMDVVGNSIKFGALKETPDREMLWHLYRNDAERVKVMEQLRQNEHVKKMLIYLEKGLLLAPKNPLLYRLGLQFQQGFRDEAELRKLQQHIVQAAPDLTEIRRQTLETYRGAKDEKELAHCQGEIRRYETLIGTPEVRAHALTLEFAETQLLGLRQAATYYGAPLDGAKLLTDATATYQREPNAASLHAVINACFLKANEELKKESAEYAELEGKCRRAISPRSLLACLLERGGPLAEQIRKNPSVKQGLARLKDHAGALPSACEMDEWALFQTVDPAEASLVNTTLKENQAGRLADEIQFQLNPLSGTAVLEQYWYRKLKGDQAGATQVYQQALKDGVPLPPL